MLDFFLTLMYDTEEQRKVHRETFSYSERWRYIGSVKPGNPCTQEGANLSE